MGTSRRALAALVATALTTGGCFGYNKSAKRWAYVGDVFLMAAGGGVIAADLVGKDDKPCMDTATFKCGYEPPFSGALVAGTVLVTAGLFGILFNATRETVKTSR